MDDNALKQAVAVFQTNQGLEVHAGILRLTRHLAVFEVLNQDFVLQVSEVLGEFKIVLEERVLYSGRAVVAGLVHTGATLVCEASLDENCLDAGALYVVSDPAQLRKGFDRFNRDWGKSYRIEPEFKVMLADLHDYLADLRLWLEQVELGIRSTPSGDRRELERQVLGELAPPIIAAVNGLFSRAEIVAARVPPEDKPAHRLLARRLMHSLVFCSPFAYRTYHKPLGYPGDYEMVNMMLRDPFEGGSLFAKAFNAWFVSQPPAEAHRNRINYLVQKLVEETARVAAQGRMARIYNLGCGPAVEVQRFLAEQPVSNQADLTLLDFNNETLAYTTGMLQSLKTQHHRSTRINLIKKSVAQVLKGRGRSTTADAETKYDLICCAGLFDYLTNQYCKQLMNLFYDMLAPGGLLVTTNVDPSNPIREMLDYMLDWNLIYRNGTELRALAPDAADPDLVSVCADITSVNVYMEVRKPRAA